MTNNSEKSEETSQSTNCDKHELVFVKNIYEDPNTPKSEWKCSKCGKIKYKHYYNKKG
jgi:hypothetical protein